MKKFINIAVYKCGRPLALSNRDVMRLHSIEHREESVGKIAVFSDETISGRPKAKDRGF